MKRIDDFIALSTPIFKTINKTPKDGLKATDIATNEFIDPKIKI